MDCDYYCHLCGHDCESWRECFWHRIKWRLLESVPKALRTRWPLKRYYYQADELAEAERLAKEWSESIKWE